VEYRSDCSLNMPNDNVLLSDPLFCKAVAEIEALGFRVSDGPDGKSVPYGIITGRSNRRWWLIPLTNARISNSALALFQPILPTAKMLKHAVITTTTLGMSGLWARQKVYISGKSRLNDIFNENDLRFAFFTGTNSPHRKVTVQVMNRAGYIKGYAKVTRNPEINRLLLHEAQILTLIQSLDLKKVITPAVLFYDDIGGANVLVTDSRRTRASRTCMALSQSHVKFFSELAQKTALPDEAGNENLVQGLRKQYETVVSRLPAVWQGRLGTSIELLRNYKRGLGPRSLSHGDFTPWNTFFLDDNKLYVFDWEYAHQGSSAGYDLIHFTLSHPNVKRQSTKATIEQVQKLLRELKFAADDNGANALFLCYLCGHTLHYIARELELESQELRWDGEQMSAVLIDAIIDRTM
jgi:hypothetical protein